MPSEKPKRKPWDKAFGAFKKNLPPAPKALLHLLVAGLGKRPDVPIAKLHAALYIDEVTPRQQQQRIGAILSKLNERMAVHGRVVKPGEKRGTYRLYTIKK